MKKHDIPISGIPCLAYQKRKETIERQIKEHQLTKTPKSNENVQEGNNSLAQNSNQCDDEMNPLQDKLNKKYVVSIQSNEEKSKENVLAPDKIHDYCKRLFEFDVIKVKKFK